MGKLCGVRLIVILQIWAFPCWTGKAAADADDAICAAGASCISGVGKAPEHPYIWPMARGPIGSHATSPHQGPHNLSSSLAWKWHQPGGRFSGASNGAMLIDDKKNLYTQFSGSIYKFTPIGTLLWKHTVEGWSNDIPALMDGVLYITSTSGYVEAISMESGARVWRSAPACSWKSTTAAKCHFTCDCNTLGGDIGAVGANKGVIVVKTHQPVGGGACKAAGLNASTGEFLWDYATDHMVWNFYPMFTDDGDSFLFQDSTGGVYRLGLDGREIWKAGANSEGWRQTWTDGGLQTGPNGVVYVMKALGGDNVGPGCVRAYRIEDGTFLWQSPNMDEVPNSWPVIGRMRKDDPLTVIVATGKAGGHMPRFLTWLDSLSWVWQTSGARLLATAFGSMLYITDLLGNYAQYLWLFPSMQPEVWGMDAETGKVLWTWAPQPWGAGLFRAEYQRMIAGQGPCIPNPVGNPTLDSNGNYYVGMHDGFIYHLTRDSNGPGVKVTSTYDAEAAFSSGGVSLAPGLMAIASCDTVFVFNAKA